MRSDLYLRPRRRRFHQALRAAALAAWVVALAGVPADWQASAARAQPAAPAEPAAAVPPAAAQPAPPRAAPKAGKAPAKPKAAPREQLQLSSSDGWSIAAWYYPATVPPAAPNTPAAPPPPVVILLHDLGGSHETVEPLARQLQALGKAVVTPDLRGHGATSGPAGRGPTDAKGVRKQDFELMIMTSGGRVRSQASDRGDVETVWNWIEKQAETGAVDANRLVVVGAGAGAAVAAGWAALDAAWPDLTTGPQGRRVRALVLVSPTFAVRNFAIAPWLGSPLLLHGAAKDGQAGGGAAGRGMPILVIAGDQDSDGVKVYEQLKRQRLDAWSEKRAGKELTQAAKVTERAPATLYLRQFDDPNSGDALASRPAAAGSSNPAVLISGFIDAVTSPKP